MESESIFDETIMILTIEGRKSGRQWRRSVLMDAAVIPPFAIHPSAERFSYNAEQKKRFTVTHIQSRAAVFRSNELRACVGFVNAVRGMDWSFFDRQPDCPESCMAYLSWDTAVELFPDFYSVLDAVEYWGNR